MKKLKFAAFILAASVIFSSCDIDVNINDDSDNSGSAVLSGENASINFLDIGQGDSCLITCGGKNVLIDGGERGEGDVILSYLEENDIDTLDYVIATHPHSDHIGGLVDIFYDVIKNDSITINEVITCDMADDIVPTTKVYNYFLQDIDSLDIEFSVLEEERNISLGDGSLRLIPSPFNDDQSLNNESVFTVFTYGDTVAVMGGDAETEEEEALVESGAFKNVDADIFKAGHHGSRTSSSTALLDEIDPEYFVISCGTDNSYGHPHDETLAKFADYSDEVYRTDLDGTVTFITDGEEISVSTEK